MLAVAAIATSLVAVYVKAETEGRIHTKVEQSVAQAKAPAPKADPLDAWIKKLILAESGGRTTFVENHGLPYIIDVNGKWKRS